MHTLFLHAINPHRAAFYLKRVAGVTEWDKPHPFISVFCLTFALVCGGLVVAPPASAEDPLYLRGYFDAMLDSRFAGLGLKVRQLTQNGDITLSARACLGPSQKRDVRWLLEKTGRIKSIRFDETAECSSTEPPTLPQTKDEPLFSDIDIRLLPDRELFAPLIADPRQARFSMSYQRYETPNETFNAASVAFGAYFGLASGFLGQSGSSQFGIQGAVFALFNLDAPSSDLVNADYWIGFPLSYRRGPRSYLIRVYHQSSHLGDEFILGNPGINRVNLSYETLEGLASYEWERWRVYGGGGYILSSEPELDPKYAHAGIEFIEPRAVSELDFIAAVDVQASEELDWARSVALQAGLEFKSASPRRLRLMVEHFRGHSPNGQFFRERLRYTGIGLYFGF